MPRLIMENVTFRRASPSGQTFTLTIPEFEISSTLAGLAGRVPIMGTTGDGKSTFLALSAGFLLPESGHVCWEFEDGERIEWGARGIPARMRPRFVNRIGFAFQSSNLVPQLTVRENLMLPLVLACFSQKAAGERAAEILATCLVGKEKPAEMLEKYPHELSGGQRQRVSLVQSFVHAPSVVLADEPTGNLDKNTREQVMRVLVDWVAQAPETRLLIWVTHHASDPALYGGEWSVEVSNGMVQWVNQAQTAVS